LFRPAPSSTLFPYTTLFRSGGDLCPEPGDALRQVFVGLRQHHGQGDLGEVDELYLDVWSRVGDAGDPARGHGPEPTLSHAADQRSEEHTSELQSRFDLVCRL